MTPEPFNPCLLLWVDREADVPRACREVGELLTFRQSFQPHIHSDQDWRLIGLWVDPSLETSYELFHHTSVLEQNPFRLRQTVGLNGIWQLYWLEFLLPRNPANPACTLESMISYLIGNQPSPRHLPASCFFPVFDADDNRKFIGQQSERLRAQFSDLIGDLMTWNRTAGILAPIDRAVEQNRSFMTRM